MGLRIGIFATLIALYFAGQQLAAHHAPLWITAALMGLVFIGLVAAMYLRVLPALLALPLLAIALASIAGMKWDSILTTVVQEGSTRLSTWILAAIFGSILAQVVEKTGIAQTAIKKTAELGGDSAMVLAVLLTIVIALLFTTLGGLGAVIMVATIVIPILLSLGLRPLYVGCLFLMAMSLGGAFNLVNWQFYQSELKLSQGQIISFALPFAVLMFITTAVFLAIEGKRMGKARYKATVTETETTHNFVPWYALLTPLIPLIPVLFFTLMPKVWHKPAEITITGAADIPAGTQVSISYPSSSSAGSGLSNETLIAKVGDSLSLITDKGTIIVLENEMAGQLSDATIEAKPWTKINIELKQDPNKGIIAVPATPVSTAFEFPIIVALLLGIIYGAITTWRKGTSTVQLLTKASFDGVGAVGPALVLMIGIGMVLKATMAPEVSAVIQPLIKAIVPRGGASLSLIWYVLMFTVLAPLALYRGPLNLYGMGAGLIGALNGLMPSGAIMGAFMSVGMIQGVSDPTNTHNVWIADYTKTDVQDILKRTLPYMWILALVGLILSGVLYYGGVIK